MKQIINDFINSIDTKLYSRIRTSKGDAECRRYLKEHLQKQLNLHVVGSSNKVDYEKGFNLAMNYISSTTIIMEQSKESEENWVKLKDFIKKHKIK